jgi:pimeloyl-ACP methyl ester carboxylesterase
VTRKRAAVIGAGIAAGALVAGTVGRTIVRRRTGHGLEAHLWELPPDDLGIIESFDGTKIAARAAGDAAAPLLLFVHGFSLDMTTWHEQWIDLSVDFRCVLLDQRGHGRSGRPAHGNLSLRALGRDIGAVLDAVAPDRPAVVIGHSMGGMAAIALAEQRPELFGPRIAGLILVGSSSTDLVRAALGSMTNLLRPSLGLGITAQRVDRVRKAVFASPGDLRGAAVRLTQFGPEAQAYQVEHIVNLTERASSDIWTDGLSSLMEMDLRYAVPRVTVPALVVVGQYDRITPPAAAVALASELPDAQLVVLEGAGHLAMLERPIELDREIRSFGTKILAPPAPKKRSRTRKTSGEASRTGKET